MSHEIFFCFGLRCGEETKKSKAFYTTVQHSEISSHEILHRDCPCLHIMVTSTAHAQEDLNKLTKLKQTF